MFRTVKLWPRSIENIVISIPKTKSHTLSILQFIFFHDVASPPERPLASIVSNIQPESKVSKAFTTESLSSKVSCRIMTSSELCSTNLRKDYFFDKFTNPR